MTTTKDRCEAAVQQRTGWGYFHRCRHPAKARGRTTLGEDIAVCGLHVRYSGTLIRYTSRLGY